MDFFPLVHTGKKNLMRGKISMKMTKDEARALSKKAIDLSKKYGIPLRKKKKRKEKHA